MSNPSDPRAQEAQEFVEQITGQAFSGPDFQTSLKDGVLLCKVLNTLKPGTIASINNSRMPFKQMENIDAYIKGCQTLGIPSQYNFMTVDLFEAKNLNQVVQNIITVKRELGYGFNRQTPTQQPLVKPADFAPDQSKEGRRAVVGEEPTLVDQTLANRTGGGFRAGQKDLTSELLTPDCIVCNRRITTTYVNACGRSWHTQCFTCKRCDAKLSASKYYEDSGKPYCEKCILILKPGKPAVPVQTKDMGFSFE